MNAERRRELRELDRALLALCDERSRLLATFAIDDPGRASAVDDLLRRYGGPLDADLVRGLFAVVDRATGGARVATRAPESTRDHLPEDAP